MQAVSQGKIAVKAFGFLRDQLNAIGLPFEAEISAAEEGMIASALAEKMCLPLSKIEAVFRNGSVINIYDRVFPGDRVAFFPPGTPGPYRVFLGIVRENLKRKDHEGGGGRDQG